jgi:maltose alpha-D-glucosyltransferase/alpha-amylase
VSATRVDQVWLAAIAGWLPSQRWFAGKQHSIASVSAESAVPITLGGTRVGDVVTLVVLRVAFVGGGEQRYVLPVAPVSAERTGLTPDDRRVIAPLDHDVLLVDAMSLPDTAAIVVAAAFRPDRRDGDGASLVGHPRRERLAAHPAMVRPLSVEQSNSSVLIGTTQIAKLVRRVEVGPNPDAELPAHLTPRFAHVPGLVATLELHLDGESEAADVLIVHDAIVNEGDLWTVLVDRLQRELVDGRAFRDSHLQLATVLGRRTAELHAALAASDHTEPGDDTRAMRMRPEPFTPTWQQHLLDGLHTGLAATRATLAGDTANAVVGAAFDRARAAGLLDAPADALLGVFDRLRHHAIDAVRIRVHGDLHLGQILATAPEGSPDFDVVFIDFEGEPARPIAERLEKRCPLSDVAGLLRSVDYAGRQALRLATLAGAVSPERFDGVDSERAAWTERLCGAIVDEYLTTIAPAHLVPADRADAQLLLDLHLLDKGLYEIRYELANRPEWAAGPLAAVTEMITHD